MPTKIAREMDHGSSIDSTIISTGSRKVPPVFSSAAASDEEPWRLAAFHFWRSLCALQLQPDAPAPTLCTPFGCFVGQLTWKFSSHICRPAFFAFAHHLEHTEFRPPKSPPQGGHAPYQGLIPIGQRNCAQHATAVCVVIVYSVPLMPSTALPHCPAAT